MSFRRSILAVVVLILSGEALWCGGFFDLGLSGVFFRGAAGYSDSSGKYTKYEASLGVLPFFPFGIGADIFAEIRYGPILFNVYAVDIEPLNAYASGSRMFGFTTGVSAFSDLGNGVAIWGGVQLYTYTKISLGDSIRFNIQSAANINAFELSSYFYEGTGFMRLGLSKRFENFSISLDIFRAYTKAKFYKVYALDKIIGYTKYPYLMIRVTLPISNSGKGSEEPD